MCSSPPLIIALENLSPFNYAAFFVEQSHVAQLSHILSKHRVPDLCLPPSLIDYFFHIAKEATSFDVPGFNKILSGKGHS